MLFLNLGMNEDYVTLFSTLIITLVLLVFGEIMPKMIGKNHSLGIACKTAIIIKVIMYALYPFVLFFYGLQKIFSRNKQEEIQEKEELDVIVDKFEDEGSIESNEADVIHKVLDLGETTVKDIMVPRIKMSAINIDSTLDEVKSFMLDNNFSRIPVYKNDKDHIIGLLFERDFFPAYIKNNKVSWKKLIKPVKYVAATMKADDLIKEMQKSKIHLAIVSGEYGEVIGIVTMEDALEELVGEIYDEHEYYRNESCAYKCFGSPYGIKIRQTVAFVVHTRNNVLEYCVTKDITDNSCYYDNEQGSAHVVAQKLTAGVA
jgi:CBS domain containing-hemolysin-like protein